MSDEQQLYGKEGIEHDAGYFSIPEPTPAVPDEPEHTEAIQTWSNNREQEAAAKPIIDRSYVRTDGEKVGEHYPDAGTVSADRAAQDLAENRVAEEAIAELDRNAQLAAEIDAARGLPQPEAQPADAQQAAFDALQQTGPQQSAPTYDSGIDPEVAAAFRNPKILSVLAQAHQENTAQVDAAINQAAQWAQTNAELAAAAILVRPELQGVHPSQIPGALQALATANPEAARQIQQQLNHAQTLTQQAAEARNVASQRASIQFQQFGKASDEAFDRAMAGENPETVRAIKETATQLLRETGLSDADMLYQWNNNALFRSVHGQTLLADAARYRMLKAGIKPAPKPIPNVQKPGGSMDRPDASDRDGWALEQRFGGPKAPLSAKQAGELLIARRARAR